MVSNKVLDISLAYICEKETKAQRGLEMVVMVLWYCTVHSKNDKRARNAAGNRHTSRSQITCDQRDSL